MSKLEDKLLPTRRRSSSQEKAFSDKCQMDQKNCQDKFEKPTSVIRTEGDNKSSNEDSRNTSPFIQS